MTNNIILKILGDFGPFSRIGKSIGYQIEVGQSCYLIDCGAPLFHLIGGHGLKKVRGLLVTHCHEDHKRWFSDLALFYRYAPDFHNKVFLMTTEAINRELKNASSPSLSTTLSDCRKYMIDTAYEDFIDYQIIGPREKYRIVSEDEGRGKTSLCIYNRDGDVVGPDVAKIIINQKNNKPRMLFKDPDYKEWVEPENFYSFSSNTFYEKDKNIYTDKEGLSIEAIKAPVWHGITGIGVKVRTDTETLIFSSDTAHDKELWKEVYEEKRTQRLNMSRSEFESASVIYGDINDYIERAWSENRYKEAINAFNDAIVVHDLSVKNSIVHTDYEKLGNTSLIKGKVILTHSPDKIISEWVLSEAGKTFKVEGNAFYEIVGDKLYPMDADIYYKKSGRYFLGYKIENGKYSVYKKDGVLQIREGEGINQGAFLYKVNLYEDVSGKYFPILDEEDSFYMERKDGRIELIKVTDDGSRGKIVEDHRGEIQKNRSRYA